MPEKPATLLPVTNYEALMSAQKSIITKLETFFAKYVAAPSEYHFVAALWAAMTYVYRELDTVPYLAITSLTKRSGKTLFGIDLLRHVCNMPMNATGMSGPVLYRKLEANNGGVLFADEAEMMASEATGKLRMAVNLGYKRGQTMPVAVPGGGVDDMPVFGPKCFVLIGDVNDTLRDRSIVFYMRRATPQQELTLARFVSGTVEAEAAELATELAEVMKEVSGKVMEIYREHPGLDWLSSRDAEIWLSLFAICQVLAPSRMNELTRAAMDIATDKTQERASYSADAAKSAEKRAERAEYCVRLLRDLSTIMKGRKHVLSEEVVAALKELATSPWRRYKGRGVTDQDIGYLLPPRLQAKNIKVATKPKPIVRRGWTKKDIDVAIQDIGGLLSELDATAE